MGVNGVRNALSLETVLVRIGVNMACCIQGFGYSGRVDKRYMRIITVTQSKLGLKEKKIAIGYSFDYANIYVFNLNDK